MLETFKARLKTKFPGVNLSQKRIDEFSARLHKKFPDLTEEADHDTRLDELNELQPFDELAKQDDKLRTLEAKTKEPVKPDPAKPDPAKPDPAPKTDADKLAALEAQFGQLADTVKKYQDKEAKGKLNETFQAKLATKKIPTAFAKRFSVDTEEQMEAMITEAETDYNAIVNEASEKNIGNKDTPLGGAVRTDNVDSDIKSWAAKEKVKV
jgi:hypothetical protein